MSAAPAVARVSAPAEDRLKTVLRVGAENAAMKLGQKTSAPVSAPMAMPNVPNVAETPADVAETPAEWTPEEPEESES